MTYNNFFHPKFLIMSKNKNDLKKYIITFDDDSIPQTRAAEMLGVSESNLTDAVSMLETAYDLETVDNLHFKELGCTSMRMSKADAEKLRKEKGVLEVIEDFEVSIIDDNNFINVQPESINGTEDLMTPTHGVPSLSQDEFNWEDDIIATELESIIQVDRSEDANDLITKPILKQNPFPGASKDYLLWNISKVGAHRAWGRALFGAGIKVAVLDTGISRHKDLIVYGGASFVPGTKNYNDKNGHGTHCAGVIGANINGTGIIGVAPLARMYAVKVLDDQGRGSFSAMLAGMAWALRNKMHVVSMSLGSSRPPVAALIRMVELLNKAGITVVAAAGNSYGSDFPHVNTPANCPGVIAVGAVDKNSKIGYFSSRGGKFNQVSISAPGVGIASTFPTNSYRSLSGTSMACPHVAGAVALIKRRFPTATPAWIKQRLERTARDLGGPGHDSTYGAGLLSCDRAV